MDAYLPLAFAFVAFVGAATPGPTVLLALVNGSRFGVAGALPGMLGAMASDLVLVGAVAAGLGALLMASEFWFSVVKWVGAAYLAWLGLQLLRSKGGISAVPDVAGGRRLTPWQLFSKSFLVAVTNPKGYIFFSALLPQFIVPSAPQASQYVTLALVAAGVDLVVMTGYALAGSQAMRFLKERGARWLDRVCGGMLISLAASLALYRRAA